LIVLPLTVRRNGGWGTINGWSTLDVARRCDGYASRDFYDWRNRMTKVARLTKAELRRAIEVAEATGKRLAVRSDGTLVFEDKVVEIVPRSADWPNWNKQRKDATL
jgi:hypothetical protein